MRRTDPTDETLLQKFLDGEEAALEALAGRYEAHLLGLARGLLEGRGDLACDAVQETWMRVIKYGATFNGSSSFKTWIYRITINRCRTMRKMQDPARNGAMPSAQADEGRLSAASEFDDELREALKRLDRPRADIILLCYNAGVTHEQPAKILNIPLGTLKSRLHAALKELRHALTREAVT